MVLKRWVRAVAVATVMVAGTASIAAAATVQGGGHGLERLRNATTRFHSIPAVEHAGYGKFADINGITCIAQPGVGAMGVHYVNGAAVGDGVINPTHPEALVYAPDASGNLKLAAVEYIVLKSQWDATHMMAPMLYGQMFMTTTAPNRYGLPDFYSLHVWIYKNHPAGKFAMWNPAVHCPAAS
jgi:hypothetical protein